MFKDAPNLYHELCIRYGLHKHFLGFNICKTWLLTIDVAVFMAIRMWKDDKNIHGLTTVLLYTWIFLFNDELRPILSDNFEQDMINFLEPNAPVLIDIFGFERTLS